MGKRRNPFDKLQDGEEPAAYIPPAASKAKRDRSWERAHNKAAVTYRNIPVELREAIKHIAQEELLVPVDDLARAFLEYGLQAYQEGVLKLQPQSEAAKLRLYPRKSAEK